MEQLQARPACERGLNIPRHRGVQMPIPTLLWRLAAPNAVATLILTSVTLADAWFVGRLGTVALASIAIVFPFKPSYR
jgi:Na+-driven multidrug efflux pump